MYKLIFKSQFVEMFKNENNIVKIGSCVEVHDGIHQTPNYQSEGIKFISVENISDIYSSKKYISQNDFDELYKVKPMKNDVFMTRIGKIGDCAVMTKDYQLAYYVSLALLRPNQKNINSVYLKYYLETFDGQKELMKHSLLNAIPLKINKNEISKIDIKLPKIGEQNKFSSFVELIDKQKFLFENIMYKRLKNKIIEELFIIKK